MSWGTGITLAFAGFVAFILFLVYSTTLQNIDLVAEDYYQQEIEYQNVIDQANNYDALAGKLMVKETATDIHFEFPHDSLAIIKGTLTFFRPSSKLDDVSFSVKSKNVSVSKKQLLSGSYLIKAKWLSGGKTYFKEQHIFVQK